MRVLGITGGIGSGKSEVLRILGEQKGVKIMEADKLARLLMMPGQGNYKKVVAAFGPEILTEDGIINRKKLGDLVFDSPEQLSRLNSIVHPGVKDFIREDIRRSRENRKEKEQEKEQEKEEPVSAYVIEAALRIQDGYREICDAIWYIHVDPEIRIRRLIESRGGDRETWEKVIRNQPEDLYYESNSDLVLENDSDPESLRSSVLRELSHFIGPACGISSDMVN